MDVRRLRGEHLPGNPLGGPGHVEFYVRELVGGRKYEIEGFVLGTVIDHRYVESVAEGETVTGGVVAGSKTHNRRVAPPASDHLPEGFVCHNGRHRSAREHPM